MSSIGKDWDLEALRARSEALFGSRHRLPTAVAIDRAPARFYARQLAGAVEVDPREAKRQLEALADAGLVREVDEQPKRGGAPRGAPPILFEREPEPFWSCLEALEKPFRRKRRTARHLPGGGR